MERIWHRVLYKLNKHSNSKHQPHWWILSYTSRPSDSCHFKDMYFLTDWKPASATIHQHQLWSLIHVVEFRKSIKKKKGDKWESQHICEKSVLSGLYSAQQPSWNALACPSNMYHKGHLRPFHQWRLLSTHSEAEANRFCTFLMICPGELLFLMAINQN